MKNSTEKTDNTATGRNAVIFKQRRNLYIKATGIVRRIDDLGCIVMAGVFALYGTTTHLFYSVT